MQLPEWMQNAAFCLSIVAGILPPQTIAQKAVEEVDTRLSHAREVLEHRFERTPLADNALSINIESLVTDRFEKRFPNRWKRHAAKVANTLIEESERHGLDPVFIMAVIATESGYHPEAIGPFGEVGLMQLRPATGLWLAKKEGIKLKGPQDLANPHVNIKLGTAYLAYLRSEFSAQSSRYIAAYNAGPGLVKKSSKRWLRQNAYRQRVLEKYLKIYEDVRPEVMVSQTQ